MTLAFYGKSRRHRWVLALLVFATLLAAMAAGAFSLQQRAGAVALNVDLDQWANDDAQWQNGNLNGNNSAYAEGLVVPFRLALEGLSPGTWTILLNHDFTAGGHKAYDYLTTWNATENGGIDLCAVGGGAVSSMCPSLGSADTEAFPTDSFVDPVSSLPVSGTQAAGNLTAYGATIDSISGPTHDGATTGNSTSEWLVTFTVPAGGDAVLLAWGAHLAESTYWDQPGTNNGAGQISGAPWHMRTLSLTDPSGTVSGNKNQDRSIQPSALGTTAGSLEITKVVDWDGATPDTNQTFTICITGPTYPTGTETGACQTAPSGGGTLTWTDILTGDYAIAETDPGSQWEVTYSTQNVTVAENQTVTATVTNRLLSATITIRKFVDDVLTAGWQFDASATGGSLVGGPSYTTGAGGTVTFYVNPSGGTANVDIDEVLQAGYNFLDAECYYEGDTPNADLGILGADQTVSGIPVVDGDAIVCDFYNQLQIAGDLNVTKTADGFFDREIDWTITKVGDPTTHNLPDDGSGSTTYDIDVNRTETPVNYRVEGTVTVMNPSGNTEDAIVASIVDANAVFSNCTPLGASAADYSTTGQVTFSPALVLVPGASVTCDYDITDLADNSLTTNEANATVTAESLVQPPATNAQAAIAYGFSGTYTGEPTEINVTDIGDASGTHNFGPFTGDSSFGYSQEFTCEGAEYDENGHATLTFDNTADIDETHDFAEETVTVNCQQPQLTLIKNISDPDGDGFGPNTAGNFTLTIAGGPSGSTPISAFVPSVSSQDISESSLPGYSFVSLVCEDELGNDLGVNEAVSSTVTMPAGALDVTCTFTNEFDPATISVRKIVDLGNTVIPAGDPLLTQTFEICIQGTTAGASYPAGDCKTVGHNQVATWDDLMPGSYTVSETPPGQNWAVTGDDGASITVATGETATERTITNMFLPGALQVTKVVDLNGAAAAPAETFTICITGPSYPSGDCKTVDEQGGVLTWGNLVPGSYDISENTPSNAWETPIISPTSVDVGPGETAEANAVTVTNTLKKGSIRVTKTFDWQGAEPTGKTFEICITGPLHLSEPPKVCQTVADSDGPGEPDRVALFEDLTPGDYQVSEEGTNIGTKWVVTIDGTETTSKQYSVAPGQETAVGVTNTYQRGSLDVAKVVNWNGPEDTSQTFTICIVGPSYPLVNGEPDPASCKVFGSGGGTQTWTDLIPGAYTVVELTPAGNWAVVYANQNVTVEAGSQPDTQNPDSTVTNTRATGALTVVKSVEWNGAPAEADQDFRICIQGPSYPLGTEDGACQDVNAGNSWMVSWPTLQTGNYTVTESFPDGDGAQWDTTVDNGDGSGPQDSLSTTVAVTSSPEAPLVVTYTNTLRGVSLTIRKTYVGDHAPEVPMILIDGNDVTSQGGPDTWGPFDGEDGINPNTDIEVVEVLPPGWLNTDVTFNEQCGTSPQAYKIKKISDLIQAGFSALDLLSPSEDAAGARVNIPPAKACEVTFVNTWSPATIVVTKTVEWGDTVNHPVNPSFEICLFDDGADTSDPANAIECGSTNGSTTVEFDGLLPGSYVVAETDPGSSWSTTVDAALGLSTTVSVVEGDTENVEVVNTFQPGALSVRKDVVLNGQAPEEFTICISGPSYPFDATWPQDGACKTWTLADLIANQTKAWNNLLPGDYTVTEQDPGSQWHVAISGSPVTVEAGDTADLQNPDATVTNTRIIPLVVEKTGAGDYDKEWTVDKITTTPVIDLADDESSQAGYQVTITSSIVNVQASGTITVMNPAGNPVDAVIDDVTDVVSSGTANVDCSPETFPVTLAPGGSLVCSYSVSGLGALDATGIENTATANVTEGSEVPGASSDTINISFTSNGPDSVDLEDVFDGGAPVSEGTDLTDGVVTYTREVTCEGIENWSSETGQGSKTVLNTATILDGETALDSDDADVQVNCQRPKLTLVKEVSDAFVPATEPLASPSDFDLTIGQAEPLSGDVTGAGSVFAYVSSGGTYPVSESSLPGYTFVSLECTYLDEAGAPQTITVTQDASSSVTMPAGASDVTCTFTNEFDPGKITVTKVVDFSGAEFEPEVLFRICLFEDGADTSDQASAIACEDVTGDPVGTPDDTAEFDNLLPGTYVVVEFFPNGDSQDWDVVLEPGDGEVTLVTGGAEGTATVTNTLKKGEIIVRKIYVGATATNADAPVVTVDGQNPAHQGVVANESEWDAVEVSPYTVVDVSEDLADGWKNVDIQYGEGCLLPEITSELDGLLDILSIVIGETPASLIDTAAAVAPGGTCVVTFTNEAFGTVVVEKIDQSANENEWDFEVNGPNEFNDTPHITGSDSMTYLDMPLGDYDAAETTAGILSSVEQCPFPNPNGEGTYVTAVTPIAQSLTQPGQTITFTFLNQDCPVVLGAGSLVIAKWSDLDADGIRDAGEPGVANWKFTVAGPEFPGGQDFFTNSNGLVLGLDGITAGFYTVTEQTQGGWAQTALSIDGVPQPVSATAVVEVKAGNNPDDWPLVEVAFGNRPPATVRVVKTVIDQVGNRDRSGWQFNLAGCGTSINGVTNANGEITWSNLQPAINCAYTVTEVDTEGFSVSPSQAQVVSPGPGEVATVSFTNSRTPTIFETPTPTNTPTATPTPTETPTPTNTPEPTETVAGERTPGPGSIATPIPPETGSGLMGTGAAGNLLMALLGLLAISGGLALFSLGRKRS